MYHRGHGGTQRSEEESEERWLHGGLLLGWGAGVQLDEDFAARDDVARLMGNAQDAAGVG